jgi:hypothetical protein
MMSTKVENQVRREGHYQTTEEQACGSGNARGKCPVKTRDDP